MKRHTESTSIIDIAYSTLVGVAMKELGFIAINIFGVFHVYARISLLYANTLDITVLLAYL